MTLKCLIQFITIKQYLLPAQYGKQMRQKRQYGKNPSPPKKALSSFLLYRAQVFQRVKASHPGLRITQLTLIISQMYAKIDSQTKARLQQQHEKNKIITAYERQQYERMYGYVEKKRRQKRKKRLDLQIRERFNRGYGQSYDM